MTDLKTFTVTVRYASPGQLVEVPVRCLVSYYGSQVPELDLANPLCPLPVELAEPPHGAREKRKRNRYREVFRAALKVVIEQHLGCAVRNFANDRIDWGDGE